MTDPRLTEKDFARAVVDLAKRHGWAVYFTWYRASVNEKRQGYQVSGFPDLVLVRGATKERQARLLFVELKLDGKQPTATQREWLELLGAVHGVGVFLWRPSDWATIMEVLR